MSPWDAAASECLVGPYEPLELERVFPIRSARFSPCRTRVLATYLPLVVIKARFKTLIESTDCLSRQVHPLVIYIYVSMWE